MKLCRYGERGREKPGLIDREGRLRDLSGHKSDLAASDMNPATLKALLAIDPDALPLVEQPVRMGAPLSNIGKFVCIGLNYLDHAAEAGLQAPSEPIIFLKATTAICGPNDDTVQPRYSSKLDWEVELAIVIGQSASYVAKEDAFEHVAGYCLVNDVSERAFQMQSTQWDKGKGCDTFGPLGPWIATRDEMPEPQDLDMWLDVNGRRMQTGNTRTMIFDVPTIISYVSRYMTLQPGDIIATGTPPGVGMGMKPEPVYLKPGDVVTLGITGLGQQRQCVVASAP